MELPARFNRFGGSTKLLGMKDEIPLFQATLDRLVHLLEAVPANLVDKKPRPEDWSCKEIAGHLIDSASNNHQRFTRLQQTARLDFPAYVAEPWVAVEKPNGMEWGALLDLVKAYNLFILRLVQGVDDACLDHVWAIDGDEKTLAFLMRDYYRHLEWHSDHLEKRITELRG